MCGISGILSLNNKNITGNLYKSLFNLQHRGQESSGFIVFSSYSKKTYKSKKFGLIEGHLNDIENFEGDMGIGHVRYPTGGLTTRKEIQPFSILKPYGISLVHNGNIINKSELEQFLYEKNIFFNSTSDSEIILNLFYYFIEKNYEKLTNNSIIESLKNVYSLCRGSFSVIIMISNYGLIFFRDKHGIRPLVYNLKNDFISISSETTALHTNEYTNVENGEVCIIDKKFNFNKFKLFNCDLRPCIFEYIYFANAESYINDILVYSFREKVGENILNCIDEKILKEIDIIVPIPMTSIISATTIANILNKPLKHAVLKNRYTHRTFINKKNDILENIRKIKIISKLVENKNILLVDDSIVRGNTIKYIIEELKKTNVKKIYFASCSPPVKYPNKYGIAIPTSDELIANNKTINDIKKLLNLDGLYYLDLDNITSILNNLNKNIVSFEDSSFSGFYIEN